MRQNPHVRICGGPRAATTLVYPTAERRDALFPAEASSTIRIFSSAENRRRVCRRISRTTFPVDPAFAMGCLLPWQESVSYFTTLRGPH